MFRLDPFQITVDKENNTTINCSRQGECDADKVHACGIDKIKDADKLAKFVTCALVDGYNSKNKSVPIEKVYFYPKSVCTAGDVSYNFSQIF